MLNDKKNRILSDNCQLNQGFSYDKFYCFNLKEISPNLRRI